VVALLEIGDAVGHRRERERVGAEVHLALAIADGERRAAAGADHQVLLALEEEGEREGAFQPGERRAGGFERGQARAQLAGAELGDGLGVGLGFEGDALGFQLGAQGAEVLDDAVVHHGDGAGAVGMGVAVGRRAVGGPAGVADAAVAADRVADEEVGERDQLAGGAAAVEMALVHGGDAGAVVAAVFEALQRLEDQRRDLVAAEDADDAAHLSELPFARPSPPSAARAASARGPASPPAGRGRRRARPRARRR
jgi:hypothetical protein